VLTSTQFRYDIRDVVFLEEANCGDAGRSGLETRLDVFERHSSQGQDWNARFARFAKLRESGCFAAGGIFLFEDRPEDCKGRAGGFGFGYF
jgi:hypothetical protein